MSRLVHLSPQRWIFWWRSRCAPEPAREAVRLRCAQAWGEYPAVLYLGPQAVTYDVPGRRGGGTVRGRGRMRWLLGGVAYAVGVGLGSLLLLPVLLPALIVLELLSARGVLDSDAWAFGRPELAVAGDPDSSAVALGDGVRDTRADLWLAWTGKHLGVVTGRSAPYRVAWQATAGPDVRAAAGEIRFTDGSTLMFAPSGTELDRLRDRNGWP